MMLQQYLHKHAVALTAPSREHASSHSQRMTCTVYVALYTACMTLKQFVQYVFVSYVLDKSIRTIIWCIPT
jgi:hypothetical protein